jgi:hypothetical protein
LSFRDDVTVREPSFSQIRLETEEDLEPASSPTVLVAIESSGTPTRLPAPPRLPVCEGVRPTLKLEVPTLKAVPTLRLVRAVDSSMPPSLPPRPFRHAA